MTIQAETASTISIEAAPTERPTSAEQTTETAVSIKNLSKRYGNVVALNNVSLEIQHGQILGLLGHNGAGKSTLMKLILGIIRPSQGTVLSLGHSPSDSKSHKYREQFGYLPENVSFYEQLSGQEVLTYFTKLKGKSRSDASRMLENVGLGHAAKRAVKTYSKGMRQRLGLAQALIGEPRLLILDEPTVGLDPIATRDFYTMVDQLKGSGSAVILCTHVLQGVEHHIDQAMIMGGGEALALGDLQSLRNASKLPVSIKFNSKAANEIGDQLSQFRQSLQPVAINDHKTQTVQLHVPQNDKMSVVRQLSQHQDVNDIEIHPPNLQDIYAHFMQKFDLSRGKTGTGEMHHG